MNKHFVLLFTLKAAKKNSEGLAPIYLRVTIDGERVEISTKRSVEIKKWNKVAQKAIGHSEELKDITRVSSMEVPIQRCEY